MEIVSRQNAQELLNYLPYITYSLQEWKLVDIRLTTESEKYFAITKMADLVHSLFREKEGKIYICNAREIFLIIRWGHDESPLLISRKIQDRVSAVSYEIVVHDPTIEGLQRLEMLIRYEESRTYADIRGTRRENIILVAGEENHVQMLVKTGIPKKITVKQVTSGSSVLAEHNNHVPDIVFLDINIQGQSGIGILRDILNVDPDAYVIMLSAEKCTPELVKQTIMQGAKGFMLSPFTQGSIMEYIKKCPTLS